MEPCRVNLVDLMKADGVAFKKSGRNVPVHCPFHEDRNESMSVETEDGLYNCHTCGASGNAYWWLVNKRGMSTRDAGAMCFGDMQKPEKGPNGEWLWEKLQALWSPLTQRGHSPLAYGWLKPNPQCIFLSFRRYGLSELHFESPAAPHNSRLAE